MTLPVAGPHVDVGLLHPRFVDRLERFFADDRIRGCVVIVSAGRSYADQKRLYKKYKAKTGNLAADPDRRFGPKGLDGRGIWQGSWHMQQEQPDGYSYAVDLRRVGKKVLKTRDVADVAVQYGLRQTVPGEWWHFQPRSAVDWFDAPALASEVEPVPIDWSALVAYINAIGVDVAASPLRRRSRGKPVEVVQRRLGALGFDPGPPDGVFGWRTRRATKSFQRAAGLKVDGVVGGRTWGVMWSANAPTR